ncbi:YidB family protein [Dactylosporangium darangshiense]
MTAADLRKLSMLLDDLEVRELLFGLAHVRSGGRAVEPGAPRLRAVVLDLAASTTAEQYHSWLSDDVHNRSMSVAQAHAAVGDDAIDDLARFTSCSAVAVAWQLAIVLPDLVDAVSPGAQVLDAGVLAHDIDEACLDGDRSAGAFGSRAH